MLALGSPPLRTSLRSLLRIAFPKFNQPLQSTFCCTSPWLRPISGQDGHSLPVHTQKSDPPEFCTPEEDDILKNLHKQGMKPSKISSYLPRRTLKSIAARVSLIFGKPSWLPEERERLRALLKAGASIDTTHAQFPHRTRIAVRNAVAKIRSGVEMSKILPWTDDEVQKLLKLRGSHSIYEIQAAHFPNRSVRSCRYQLEKFVARSPVASELLLYTRRLWSYDVDELRKLHSQGLGVVEIGKILKRRTGGVMKKAAELGLTLEHSDLRGRTSNKRWTEEEDALLLPLITRPSSLSTAQKLFPDRSYGSVSARIVCLRKREGLSRPQKPWTQDQDTELLRLNSLGHTCLLYTSPSPRDS